MEPITSFEGHLVYISTLFGAALLFFLVGYKKVVYVSAAKLSFLLKTLLTYIAAPSILFVFSVALSFPVKAVLAFLLVAMFARAWISLNETSVFSEEDGYLLRLGPFFLAVGLLILSCASLLHGYGFVADWGTHRSKLLALYLDPFNPGLEAFVIGKDDIKVLEGARFIYYYNMYIPAGYFVRILSWFVRIQPTQVLLQTLTSVFFIWNLCGLLLAFLLAPAAFKKVFWRPEPKTIWGHFFPALIVFAGAHYWYRAIQVKKLIVLGHMEWSSPYYAQFTSFIALWVWLPGQFIAAFLGVLLILIYRDKFEIFPLALWGLFVLSGSAWAFPGSFLLLMYWLIAKIWSEQAGRLKETGRAFLGFLWKAKAELIAFGIFLALCFFFYTSRLYSEKLELNKYLFKKNGFLKYLVFLIIEFTPLGIAIILSFLAKRKVPKVIYFSIAFLAVLALLWSGTLNDLAMRASIPMMMILMLFTAGAVQEAVLSKSDLQKIFVFFFILCCLPLFAAEVTGSWFTEGGLLESIDWAVRQYSGSQNIFKVLAH